VLSLSPKSLVISPFFASISGTCTDLQKGDFGERSWQTTSMTDQNIKAKQVLIQQLRTVAENETAWLEKNRLLYIEKRSRLNSLVEQRSARDGEVIREEQKLSNQVALYESRRSGMRNLAKEINQEELRFKELRARAE